MGPKSADNLVKEIDASRSLEFSRLLFGIGIRHVGERTAQILASTLDRLSVWSRHRGRIGADATRSGPNLPRVSINFFRQPENRALIERLRAAGLPMESNAVEQPLVSKVFDGKDFRLTGTLDTMTREEATALIAERGGRVSSSVSKKTSFVIAGRDPGSKLEKARELKVQILDEQQFRAML